MVGGLSRVALLGCRGHGPFLRVSHQGLSLRARWYSSNPGDSNDDSTSRKDGDVAKEDIPKKTGRRPPRPPGDPVKAKEKLSQLLQSIVKDNEVRKKTPEPEPTTEVKKKQEKLIDFKLARPERHRKTEEEVKKEEEDVAAVKEIGKQMLTAVKKVAATIEPEAERKVVESELVAKLKSSTPSKVNLNELFEGMKVDKSQPSAKPVRDDQQQPDLSRARRVRRDMGGAGGGYQPRPQGRDDRWGRDRPGGGRPQEYQPIDLFGAKPLGIFTKGSAVPPSAPISYLKTWDLLAQKDLQMAATHPPANGFEEMIMWTEQGKLWHFPINNEQGLDIEAKVSFEEHIFLEPNIDPWCPKKGPIRHFMELVCIGLSRNPYLTVQEKKDQLEWYHLYFKGKAKVIKDVGAGEIK